MDYKATINILGTCVSRDTFSYHAQGGGYKIQKYVNEFDPFFFTGDFVKIDKAAYDAYDLSGMFSNFRKRCLYLDATKTVMDYIKEADSDYLVIDSAICRNPSLKVGDTYVSGNRGKKEALDVLKKDGIISEKVAEEIKVSPEDMEELLKPFADEVLKVYIPDRIILTDIQASFAHYDGKALDSFASPEPAKDQNMRMRKGFDILKRYFSGCHIIPMPDAVICDTNHWLKVAILHYTREYYDYAFDCIEVINQKLPREEEERKIKDLHTKCTEHYYKSFFNLLALSFAESDAKLKKEEKRREHIDSQAKLLRKYAEKATKKLKPEQKIKTVAIYGWTRLSELIMKISAENGIKPVCVVENVRYRTIGGNIIKGGAPVLRRGGKIPDVDCIVITDLLSDEKLLSVLKKRYECRVLSAEEFLDMFTSGE